MDNNPEREIKQPERIISIGEQFYLFDPKYTKSGRAPRNRTLNPDNSEVFLKIQNSTKIPLAIITYDAKVEYDKDYSNLKKERTITPFNPEEGYNIDSLDFNIITRLKKIEALRKELQNSNSIDLSKAPLDLDIGMDGDTLNEVPTTAVVGFFLSLE